MFPGRGDARRWSPVLVSGIQGVWCILRPAWIGIDTFLTVVRRVVNGNLDGTRHLTGERYPGSSETLRLLDSV